VAEKKLCFVIGPIGEPESEPRIHADWLLEGIIEPVLGGFPDFKVKRADQDPRPGLIDAQLINDLLNAELVIADLSFLNPNVYYEIGIRHMAQRPIIHMQLATEKPPFDLSLYRAVKFSRSKYRDLGLAQAELKRAIEAVLAEDYEIENPVTNARGRLKLDQSATSEQRLLFDQLDAFSERIEMLEDQWRFLSPQRPSIPLPSSPDRKPTLLIDIDLAEKSKGEVDRVRQWLDATFGLKSVMVGSNLRNVLAEVDNTAGNIKKAREIMKIKAWPDDVLHFRVSL
jgi:hypothetical protein